MKRIYCIPKLNQLDKFLAFSKEYNAGFEYNDFFLPFILDDAKKVDEIIQTYLSLDRDRSEDTLHGVFLDICINSDDPLIYEVSDKRIHQSMDIAMRLGVKAVIFHTNHIPNFRLQSYVQNWLDRNEVYWRSILKEYPTIKLYIENMFDEDPYMLQQLAMRMSDEPNFAVCFDMAHAHISSTPLSEWCHSLSPYISHLHINDNNKLEDTHDPVGSMSLPWQEYKLLTEQSKNRTFSVLIEVQDYEALLSSVKYMKEHRMYPFVS